MDLSINKIKNMKLENLFIIGYGLSGGFGGAQNYEVIEAENQAEADEIAFEMACDEYEQYDGMYGLRSIDDIMEEDELDESDAEEQWIEEREGWLDYSAVPYSKEAEKKVLGYHYSNTYKEITG